MSNPMRQLPAVHTIMEEMDKCIEGQYEGIGGQHIPKDVIKEWVQQHLEELRSDILDKPSSFEGVTKEELQQNIFQKIIKDMKSYRPFKLQRVINGTGTVLHTNIGRARLSELAVERVVETAKHYSTLEYNIDAGERGSRHDILQDLLLKATGGEAAMVVNNNAAAVYLILRGLCRGKEVIVSRGELVEIGGSFRVSTIMEESDATLIEVGTTNKTHAYDYKDAITEQTGMLMKVHTSNFKTVGFTKEVSSGELKEIANTNSNGNGENIIVYEDLGSGSLYPFRHDGIGEEPVVKESLQSGADIISFSGDKLLGGPQAGIIVGKKALIDRLKKHPLARVLRVDKMTLAALEATLHTFVYSNEVEKENPTVRDILQTEEEIERKVDNFLGELEKLFGALGTESITVGKIKETSLIGGGTMPTVERPTVGITLSKLDYSPNGLEKLLRTLKIPVICRVKGEHVFIDFRTIAEDEISLLVKNIIEVGKA
ncbi:MULTISPECIES: L-seryl-tRNA(Sec) selenium transferase [Bacillaceae]|uniref:L-seryl-tRNA(Sec) selenium transferase n=1 Tax=Evansella alkalicola TaxID=745819 RepID=A0ABS6JVU0_9BACI|nr:MULTISPECIES: L-seryl-tRNA(Sec) selenium transferase [Bacillaceae]MBU9721362.1 L-seryl-tRNA(Sec) selenium transferase [Bacillus alkalicola]